MSNFLSSFSHITSQVPGIQALVSVQLPSVSGFQAISDGISRLFGNKRAAYLGLTNSGLCHIQTMGSQVVKKTEIESSTIDVVRVNNGNLPGHTNVSLPNVQITTKKINFKQVKESGETKTIEEPQYTNYAFSLFPITFGANLKYSQTAQEILNSTQMRKQVLGYLQSLDK
jgi:hypothetical protein